MWACGRELFSRRSSTLGQGAQHILQAIRWIHDDAQTFPKFKNELRRLYKLIHPDLLHNFPTEQVSIQRGLILLRFGKFGSDRGQRMQDVGGVMLLKFDF